MTNYNETIAVEKRQFDQSKFTIKFHTDSLEEFFFVRDACRLLTMCREEGKRIVPGEVEKFENKALLWCEIREVADA